MQYAREPPLLIVMCSDGTIGTLATDFPRVGDYRAEVRLEQEKVAWRGQHGHRRARV